MILLGRLLVRVLSFLLLLALALVGLAAAVFCIQSGRAGLSLTHLAKLATLPDFRATVGGFLGSLESMGPTAIVALLCGIGAVLLGLLLLAGLLAPTRDRLVVLSSDGDEGQIAARRRPLAKLGQSLALGATGVTAARARARSRRTGGGHLKVSVTRSRTAQDGDVKNSVESALAPLTEPFKLKPRVTTRLGEGGKRVQ